MPGRGKPGKGRMEGERKRGRDGRMVGGRQEEREGGTDGGTEIERGGQKGRERRRERKSLQLDMEEDEDREALRGSARVGEERGHDRRDSTGRALRGKGDSEES